MAPSHPFRTELHVGLLSVLNALLGIGRLWKRFGEKSHLGSAWVGAQLIDVLCAPYRDIYSELHTLTATHNMKESAIRARFTAMQRIPYANRLDVCQGSFDYTIPSFLNL